MDKQIRDKRLNILKKQNVCCNGNECGRCDYDGDNCVEERLADTLIESGLIIPENAVVLTDDELYEELKTCKVVMIVHDADGKKYVSLDDYNEYTERLGKIARQRKARIEQLEKLLDDRCDRCIEQERKEMAAKFASLVKENSSKCYATHNGVKVGDASYTISESKIDEICKEIINGKSKDIISTDNE